VNWQAIEDAFSSSETLTLFSLTGLPTKGRAKSTSRQTTLLGIPFGRTVAVTKKVDPGLLDYYTGLELGPKRVVVLDGTANLSADDVLLENSSRMPSYSHLAGLCPSPQSRELTRLWNADHAFAECSSDVFRRVLGRDFLLLKCRDHISTLPAMSVPEAQRLGSVVVWQKMNRFSQGLLLRQYYSVFGDAIHPVKSLAELELILQTENPEGKLLVPNVPRDRIVQDLEIAFSVENGRGELLGAVRQIIEKNRHVGSTDVELSPEVLSQLNDLVDGLAMRLHAEGFFRGIFGLDGFVVEEERGLRFLAYDLNPCLSQAFFPLFQKRKIENRLGKARHFVTHLYSILPEISFEELEQSGALVTSRGARGMYPILFDCIASEGPAFGRTSLMAMFLSDTRFDLQEQILTFEAKMGRGRKIYKLPF